MWRRVCAHRRKALSICWDDGASNAENCASASSGNRGRSLTLDIQGLFSVFAVWSCVAVARQLRHLRRDGGAVENRQRLAPVDRVRIKATGETKSLMSNYDPDRRPTGETKSLMSNYDPDRRQQTYLTQDTERRTLNSEGENSLPITYSDQGYLHLSASVKRGRRANQLPEIEVER